MFPDVKARRTGSSVMLYAGRSNMGVTDRRVPSSGVKLHADHPDGGYAARGVMAH